MHKLPSLFTLTFIAILSGCSAVGGKFAPSTLLSMGSDEVLVVGKIKLIPPLKQGEQRIAPTAKAAFENKALLITGDRLRGFDEVDEYDMRHLAQVDLNKTFFYLEDKKSQLIYSGGYVQLDLFGSQRDQKIYLPGGLSYKLKAGQKALYIGTLVYHRDDYSQITKVDIENEYEEANREFKNRYGSSVKLVHIKPEKHTK